MNDYDKLRCKLIELSRHLGSTANAAREESLPETADGIEYAKGLIDKILEESPGISL